MPLSHSPNSNNSHLSPRSYTSGVSPKPSAPNPRLNPFAPLSPDMPENQLQPEGVHGTEIDRLLGVVGVVTNKKSKLIRYDRDQLLKVAAKGQKHGWVIPQGLGPLETWFGSPSSSKASLRSVHDDPAIASIDPTGGETSRRPGAGGFEQGFGYGGGIGGGRGLARGGKNIGLRRQEGQVDANGLPLPDHRRDAFGGQMGRFSVRPQSEKPMRLGGDEMSASQQPSQPRRDNIDRRARNEGDWRSKNALPPARTGERRPHQNWQQAGGEDESAPAWMDDGPSPEDSAETVDPAIAGSGPEPMFNFVPGEDMIAAHRRHRGTADDWRGGGGKQLVSFFGGDAASASGPAISTEPKTFNAADYLLSNGPTEEEHQEEIPEPSQERPNAYTSRFAKFFGGPEAPSSGSGPSPFTSSNSLTAPPQRFSSASPQNSVSPQPAVEQPPPQNARVDDHMSRLMGLLKTASPAATALEPPRDDRPSVAHEHERHASYDLPRQGGGGSSVFDQPNFGGRPDVAQAQQPFHGILGQPQGGPPGLNRDYAPGPPPPQPHHLLQHLYQGRSFDESQSPAQQQSRPPPPPPSGPDLLHLLTQGQGQGSRGPPPPPPMQFSQGPPRPPQMHHSMPPGYGSGPVPGVGLGPMRSPNEYREEFMSLPHLMPPHQSQSGGQPSPQGYPNGLFQQHMYGSGPPGPHMKGPGYVVGPGNPPGFPPGMQYPPHSGQNHAQGSSGTGPLGFRQLGAAQQDMLATLAGLGRS
ncbi:hypothetical protein BD324DRAFT_612100 [Kockovaella imperatae]|uniref:Uncharacterized protein n=1 Tax=Kockovaella imperatae TaxID=4999 RepID=A0A1Y1URV2_9TREE|nr:hypothetical protein BD324DRAFT_612100 [Kockovaella imperatae]ORX40783.1 hypothetical protein BD324DRAFT_612100 [Kockovaella imperatae]